MCAARFRPIPYPVQSVHKRYSHTPGVYLALFADDTCIYTTLQRGLCYQKTAARSHFNGIMAWTLEHKD